MEGDFAGTQTQRDRDRRGHASPRAVRASAHSRSRDLRGAFLGARAPAGRRCRPGGGGSALRGAGRLESRWHLAGPVRNVGDQSGRAGPDRGPPPRTGAARPRDSRAGAHSDSRHNHHPQRYGFPPHHPPMRSFLGVPVVARGKVFGNLYLTEKVGVDEFSVEDEAIAVLLAASTAVAVENARLHEASQDLLGQVRTMQPQRDLFFAMMNHELRNALTGVYGWAERLVKGKSAEANAQAAREVYEGADRTITLLNNFLDLTRLDAGKVHPVWREVDVANSVHRALTGVRPAAEAKGIALDERSPDAP